MLIQILANRPQMLGPIVANTPVWVWGLLAALLTLGLTQARARTASAAAMLALIAPFSAPAGTRYDAAARRFDLPGSWIPLVLIVGTFLTKYVVGVELAMQPSLATDGQYTLIVGAIYGAFSGIFAGRAARLWRLAVRPAAASSPVLTA